MKKTDYEASKLFMLLSTPIPEYNMNLSCSGHAVTFNLIEET